MYGIEYMPDIFPLLLKEGWPDHFLIMIQMPIPVGVVDCLSIQFPDLLFSLNLINYFHLSIILFSSKALTFIALPCLTPIGKLNSEEFIFVHLPDDKSFVYEHPHIPLFIK